MGDCPDVWTSIITDITEPVYQSTNPGISANTILSFSCQTGYHAKSQETRTCTNGGWTPGGNPECVQDAASLSSYSATIYIGIALLACLIAVCIIICILCRRVKTLKKYEQLNISSKEASIVYPENKHPNSKNLVIPNNPVIQNGLPKGIQFAPDVNQIPRRNELDHQNSFQYENGWQGYTNQGVSLRNDGFDRHPNVGEYERDKSRNYPYHTPQVKEESNGDIVMNSLDQRRYPISNYAGYINGKHGRNEPIHHRNSIDQDLRHLRNSRSSDNNLPRQNSEENYVRKNLYPILNNYKDVSIPRVQLFQQHRVQHSFSKK